jgi:hypothetical protein
MKSLILHCLLIVACAFSQEKPAWIDSPQGKYPTDQYLAAVGSGDTRKAAENDAAANLAAIFQSNIKAEQTIKERYRELYVSPSQSSLEHQNETVKHISVSSKQTLYNMQYAESFTDNAGRTYVLAVLERQPTAEIYNKRIEENERMMDAYIEQSRLAQTPVLKFANLNAALVFNKTNEPLKKQLGIIVPGLMYASKSKYDEVKVQEMLLEARKGVPFSVHIANDSQETIGGLIRSILNDQGFIVTNDGILKINGNVSFEKIDLKRKEKFVRWSYSLSIADTLGTVVASFDGRGREGHLTYEEARARALRTMSRKIKTDFSAKVNEYFDKLVRK